MAIISKNRISDLAKNHDLLGADYLEKNIKGSSYDLRIGTIYKNGEIYSSAQENIQPYISIKPSEIVTMLTLEVITIPSDKVGTVFPINRMSSKGLLILNPGHIDPGFKGPISVCAINLSKEVIPLSIGDDIFTLIISDLSEKLEPQDLYKFSYNSRNRKGYEISYYKDKFSNLSNSIFDLVAGYTGANRMLREILLRKFWNKIKSLLAYFAPVATILGGIYLLFPNSLIFENKIQIEKKYEILDSKYRDLDKRYQDLNLNYKTVISIRDSISNKIKDSVSNKIKDSVINKKNGKN